jgi:hypothetical protein
MKYTLIVDHLKYVGPEDNERHVMPDQFINKEFDCPDAETLQQFVDDYAEEYGWKIKIVQVVPHSLLASKVGTTKELHCPHCNNKTDHQFAIVDFNGLDFMTRKYVWQCMECHTDHPPVLTEHKL